MLKTKPQNLDAAGSIRADSLRQVIQKGAFLISLCWAKLSKRMFFSDFFAVACSVGFVMIPAFLVGLVLLILPQGRDTLLIIVEQMMSGNWWSLVGLLIAIVLWSLFSELAVRYAISISDNSGLNLSDIRVLWRKTVQKLLAAIFLLWPGLLIIVGFLITLFSAEYIKWPQRLLYIGIALILIIGILWSLSFLYFRKFEPAQKGKAKRTRFGHRSLPEEEQIWLNKLYGIYNDYIFSLPKPTNFKGLYRENLQEFTDLYLHTPGVNSDHFPQDKNALDRRRVVPESFVLLNPGKIMGSTGIYKWIYGVPPSKVYPVFHRQIGKMGLISLCILILISFIPAEWPFYDHVGAPGLVCLAFACYTGLYAGLLYIDKVILLWFPISIRVLLLVWVLSMSYINADHPVRLYGKKESRPELQVHFRKWFKAYKQMLDQRVGHSLNKYPVVFISAEGGAFRTGAYTALFLTQMEADLIKRKHPVDLRHSIYAMSGVSGGAVGLGFYNAAAFRSAISIRDTTTVKKTRQFFLHDSLSPIIGKMFFAEFLNLFYWRQANNFDRAAALEKSWESAYGQFVGSGSRNIYLDEFIEPDTGRSKPLLFVNTTEIETGQQCWMAAAMPQTPLFAHTRDLLRTKIASVRYSTAINFSSRFPLFSPGAAIGSGKIPRLHYLDGGYIENTGTGTLSEILSELRVMPEYNQITPVVISLLFSETSKEVPDIKMMNEITEIIAGLYNSRTGRSESAKATLADQIREDGGIMIQAPLMPREQKIPMNWVLSEQSMNRIQGDIKKKLLPDSAILSQFFQKGLIYLPYR